jgi:hypothetical protein
MISANAILLVTALYFKICHVHECFLSAVGCATGSAQAAQRSKRGAARRSAPTVLVRCDCLAGRRAEASSSINITLD